MYQLMHSNNLPKKIRFEFKVENNALFTNSVSYLVSYTTSKENRNRSKHEISP